jgi:hypothetical protein
MHSIKHSALLRNQLLIDESVQGALLRRTALYCGCSAVYFITILIFTESITTPDQTILQSLLHNLNEIVYWAPGLMLMSPIVLYDLLRVTNRFAGPVFRLQREMQRLIDCESTSPLTFRERDYWMEMAVAFNKIRDEMLERRGQQSGALDTQQGEGASGGDSSYEREPAANLGRQAAGGALLVGTGPS